MIKPNIFRLETLTIFAVILLLLSGCGGGLVGHMARGDFEAFKQHKLPANNDDARKKSSAHSVKPSKESSSLQQQFRQEIERYGKVILIVAGSLPVPTLKSEQGSYILNVTPQSSLPPGMIVDGMVGWKLGVNYTVKGYITGKKGTIWNSEKQNTEEVPVLDVLKMTEISEQQQIVAESVIKLIISGCKNVAFQGSIENGRTIYNPQTFNIEGCKCTVLISDPRDPSKGMVIESVLSDGATLSTTGRGEEMLLTGNIVYFPSKGKRWIITIEKESVPIIN